jgi:RimJ/RimL family protein N-acetyltransferase
MSMDVLRGERVVLRPLRPEDAEDVAAACADELIQRFLPHLPSPYTLADAQWWITEGASAAIEAGGWTYGLADPDSDRIIGGGGMSRRRSSGGEIGYWVAPWARGRGIAAEAARLLATQAFAIGIPRLELRTDQENLASQRVALAAGFVREGLARGAGQGRDGSRYDQVVWARLATDSGEPTARAIPDLPGRAELRGPGDLGGELTDGVVTLRPLTVDDADDLFELRALPESVLRSVPPDPPDRDDVRRRCAIAPSAWIAGMRADLTIRDAATDAFAGDIGLYYHDAGTQQAMIGYGLTREYRGRGFTTRAVNLLVEWAFANLPLARIIAGTAPDNVPSHRVLARAGFVREAYQRDRLPGAAGSRVDDIQWVVLRPKG